MKKHLVRVALFAAMTSPLALVSPASAGTDSPGCVTRAEYRAVSRGMTKTRVHGIFDTAGTRLAISSSGGYAAEVRTYKVCRSPYSAVSISFDKQPGGDFKLSAKAAVWVG